MKRHEIINKLIQENGFTSYCEIGIGDGNNFSSIQCENKIGVDPEYDMVKFAHLRSDGKLANVTSDDFFLEPELVDGYQKFDLIFLDGLHHSDQLERDILNSWKYLNPKGMILIHDIKPHSEEMTIVPRQTKQWTGDVFKCWAGLQKTNLKLEYIEEEFGLGVIHKSRHKLEAGLTSDITFQEYFDNKGWEV